MRAADMSMLEDGTIDFRRHAVVSEGLSPDVEKVRAPLLSEHQHKPSLYALVFTKN